MRGISKFSNYFVIVIFLVIIFIPALGIFFDKPASVVRTTLNREPYKFPSINIKKPGKTDFKQIENWFIDHTLFLTSLSKLWSNSAYKLGASIKPGQVIIGKDQWLFLGNDYADSIDQYTGKNKPKEAEIYLKLSILRQMDKVAKQNKIPFLVAIAPDKHEIYSEYLPNYIHKSLSKNRIELLQQAMLNQGIDFIDLKQVELNAKNTLGKQYGDIYLKGDSHWNYLGAYAAYQAISAYMQQKGLQTKQLQFDFIPQQTIYSDLTNFLQIDNLKSNNPLPDTAHLTIDLFGRDIEGNETKLANFQGTPSGMFKNPYENINKDAQNRQTCLLIGDSFSHALGFYFYSDFYNTIRIYTNNNNWNLSALIEKYHPDLIVFEKVERDLAAPFVSFQNMANQVKGSLPKPTLKAEGKISRFKIKSDEISVKGWAYLPNLNAGNSDVYLKLVSNRRTYRYSMNKMQIHTVDLIFKKNGTYLDLAGFYGKISRQNLLPGTYKLSLLVVNNTHSGEIELPQMVTLM